MYREQTWLEVKQLRAEGMPIAKIACICGMSRNTVYRLLKLHEPPLFVGPREKLTAREADRARRRSPEQIRQAPY